MNDRLGRRQIANENATEAAYLTVSQIAAALSCDRGMVYALIEKGELLGVKPFHANGVLRVPVKSFRAYEERLVEAAEQRISGAVTSAAPRPKPKRRVRSDHAAHNAAKERMRARGLLN